jgi:peptide chain release factor 2
MVWGFSAAVGQRRPAVFRQRCTAAVSVGVNRLRCLSTIPTPTAIAGDSMKQLDLSRRLAVAAERVARNTQPAVVDMVQLAETQRELEARSAESDFWDDPVSAQAVLQSLSEAKTAQRQVEAWKTSLGDLEDLLVLLSEYNDQDANEKEPEQEYVAAEVNASLLNLEAELEAFETRRLLSGPHDRRDCMLSVHCGLGGSDAQDWTAMLVRMYTRCAERRGFQVVCEEQLSAEVGLKGATLRIVGPYAYGLLSVERGTHRLVRISPFNSLGKRQTSFAGVETWPVLDDSQVLSIDIPDKVRSLSLSLSLFHFSLFHFSLFFFLFL